MKDQLTRLFRYEAWANRLALESLKQLQGPEQALGLFAHILAGQQAWLARLKNEDPSRIEIWPSRSLAECEELCEQLVRTVDDYLESLTESDLEQGVTYRPTYRNPEGRAFHHAALDILTHLAFHSHYHRGQIAVHVRQAGGVPAATDFMIYLRENPDEATVPRLL